MLLGSSGSEVGSSSIIASTGGMGEAWDYNMYHNSMIKTVQCLYGYKVLVKAKGLAIHTY